MNLHPVTYCVCILCPHKKQLVRRHQSKITTSWHFSFSCTFCDQKFVDFNLANVGEPSTGHSSTTTLGSTRQTRPSAAKLCASLADRTRSHHIPQQQHHTQREYRQRSQDHPNIGAHQSAGNIKNEATETSRMKLPPQSMDRDTSRHRATMTNLGPAWPSHGPMTTPLEADRDQATTSYVLPSAATVTALWLWARAPQQGLVQQAI